MEHAAEPSQSSDPVARVLLPVLLHEVNNATQLLVGLRAILEIPGGDAMFNKRADDLGRTSAMMDDLGFALAVVATAGGANMLLARRNERSLAILQDLTLKALMRSGQERISLEGDAPRTTSTAMEGWQPAWSLSAALIAACGPDGERNGEWSFRWDGERLVGQASAASGASVDPAALRAINEKTAPSTVCTAEGAALIWTPDASWVQI